MFVAAISDSDYLFSDLLTRGLGGGLRNVYRLANPRRDSSPTRHRLDPIFFEEEIRESSFYVRVGNTVRPSSERGGELRQRETGGRSFAGVDYITLCSEHVSGSLRRQRSLRLKTIGSRQRGVDGQRAREALGPDTRVRGRHMKRVAKLKCELSRLLTSENDRRRCELAIHCAL
jgi:hypothetical protein